MLIIDAGNSRIKWGWWADGGIARSGVCDDADGLPSPQALGVVADDGGYRVAAVSVASPAVRARLEEAVCHRWNTRPEFLVPAPSYGALRCAYAQPSRLGVDRWAALVAGFEAYGVPLVVVDCGTAVTIDYVDADGVHQGGVIIPGLRTMRRSLNTGTAQLPEVNGPAEGALGVDTAAAIRNGTFHALVGAIDHIVSTLAEPPGISEPHYLLTGGDAPLLSGHLSAPYVVDNDLVLRGAALLTDPA